MGYTYYNPLKVWLDPASIADVVSYMQTYLEENPIKDTEEINQIIADYIAAHPELIGGVQSVNGETGEVVLTASDINTTGSTTIQAVLTSLSSQISDIVQTVTQNTNDITDLKSNFNQIVNETFTSGVNKNDGEYLIGIWTDVDTFNSSSNYYRSKNLIPVSEGDVVRAVEEGDINYKGIALYNGDTLIGVSASSGTYAATRTYITIDGTGYYYYSLTIPSGVTGVSYQYKKTIIGIADMITVNAAMPTTYTPYVETSVFSMADTFKGNHENISDFDTAVLALVNALKGKKVGFLGDSYTDVSYYYGAKIAAQTGMIDVANGKQGSRIFSDNSWTSGGETITALSFWHRVSLFTDNDFNAICIFGGINDAQTRSIYETNLGTIDDVALTTAQIEGGTVPTTFYQAYKTVIEMLWEKYPTLPLLIIIPPHQLNASYNPTQTSYMGIDAIVSAEKAIAEYYGIPVCDLYSKCQQLNNYSANVSAYRLGTSNIHPNNAGQEVIAKLVKQSLEQLLS